ncbi:MAG TPA: hypothetical protein VGQ99_03315 [Tepidisphaeraceae bacterium]|jgi:hypothetical protein|nr:hypothetical protein [Tepidisphaeraceae bacterium]
MLVIADSSPLIVLVNIGHIQVLPKLFGEVVIPPAVASELTVPGRPQIVRNFAAARPEWLRVQAPKVVQQIPELHQGESEALSLALGRQKGDRRQKGDKSNYSADPACEDDRKIGLIPFFAATFNSPLYGNPAVGIVAVGETLGGRVFIEIPLRVNEAIGELAYHIPDIA